MKMMKDENSVKAFFSGICGPKNPGGAMGMGMYIDTPESSTGRFKGVVPRPNSTITIAEYIALIALLKQLQDVKHKNIVIKGDSQKVIMQMNKTWGIKVGMGKTYALDAKDLLTQLKKKNDVDILRISKTENTIAISLSKKGIALLKCRTCVADYCVHIPFEKPTLENVNTFKLTKACILYKSAH